MTATTALAPVAPIETGSAEVVLSGSSVSNAIAQLKNGQVDIFHTFQGADWETQLDVISATTDALPLAENLDKTINLANVVVQGIEMADDDGVLQATTRIILVAEDGSAYAAISSGIFKSLQNIFGILGYPHEWNGPLPIQVTEKRSRAGFRFMTVTIVREKAASKK